MPLPLAGVLLAALAQQPLWLNLHKMPKVTQINIMRCLLHHHGSKHHVGGDLHNSGSRFPFTQLHHLRAALLRHLQIHPSKVGGKLEYFYGEVQRRELTHLSSMDLRTYIFWRFE